MEPISFIVAGLWRRTATKRGSTVAIEGPTEVTYVPLHRYSGGVFDRDWIRDYYRELGATCEF